MSWNFELLCGPYGGTTEGPVWDGRALLFTHIPGNRIMRFDPTAGTCTEWRTNTHGANGLMSAPDGRLYGCLREKYCIGRFEPNGGLTLLPNRLDGRRTNHPNDLAIDRRGRIWFSDPFGNNRPVAEREIDHASVLRLTAKADGDWTLERMTFDTTSPNGVLFSRDERVLYVAESNAKGNRELRSYPLRSDDTLGAPTVLHTFGEDVRGRHRGIDGMCMDSDGDIVACAGAQAAGPGPMIYVFAPSGRVLEAHPCPVDRPTNCTFGDPGLGTLYVTTRDGHLFRVRDTGRRGANLHA